MENNGVDYNTLIRQFRNTSPVLKEPERLTQSIVGKIERIAAVERKSRFMRIAGNISGIAAGLLLSLLLYDTMAVSISAGSAQAIRQKIPDESKNKYISLDDSQIDLIIKKKAEINRMKERLAFFNSKTIKR